MTALIAQDPEGPILRLTLNDPASRNSLSEEMMAALQKALEDASTQTECRVIVIAAHGPAFCSGHNLKEITSRRSDADGGLAYFGELMAQCSRLMQTVVGHPRPIIAEVRGMASAAGCQLVASCDLAVASDRARFCTPGVDIGLFCSTPMVALSRNVARKHAMEMLLTGDVIDATEALRIGLINRVVPSNELAEQVNLLAHRIASKSKAVVTTGKQAFYRQIDMPLQQAYEHASQVMVENLLFADAQEGIGAFVEKRQPHWQDR